MAESWEGKGWNSLLLSNSGELRSNTFTLTQFSPAAIVGNALWAAGFSRVT
jgi:hypothetical protein